MTKLLLAAGVISTTAATLILLTTATANAGAPTVVGQKYSDANAALSSASYTAKVGTRFGDGASQADCVVTAQRTESKPQYGSHDVTGTTVVLSLNCDPQEASATKPGYSAGSPEGRAAAASASAAAAASAAASPTASAGG